ncbi:uncharacterized protein CCOS01_06055 [Colletotrichum costaricense]|uniref:Uncharacterized protein n=1 Tax=Colletotrichum costaricense TaxID=1209916 RepID=A0AAJ0E3I4_9PEZI|nr:uncharacterized protein CCOS01_06055 [Colletotrichum costaricense]KAK1530952.1 hypothetical protein CCOS01_06055 [Colletotrichum costaricense]
MRRILDEDAPAVRDSSGWAAGSNLMFKEATLGHAGRIEKSLAALGLNCNIALKSVKRCNVYDKRDSPELKKRKGDLLDEMYPSILFDLITAPEKSASSFNRRAASRHRLTMPRLYTEKDTKTPAMPARARPPLNQPAARMAGPASGWQAAPHRASRPAQHAQPPPQFAAPCAPAWVPRPPGQQASPYGAGPPAPPRVSSHNTGTPAQLPEQRNVPQSTGRVNGPFPQSGQQQIVFENVHFVNLAGPGNKVYTAGKPHENRISRYERQRGPI